MIKNCLVCNKEFYTKPARMKVGRGKYCSRDCAKHTLFKKGELLGEKNPLWKGDEVGYVGIHRWVERQLGKPMECAKCGDKKKGYYEWANISQNYKRNIADWIRLCKKCHHQFDNLSAKIWTTRRLNLGL